MRNIKDWGYRLRERYMIEVIAKKLLEDYKFDYVFPNFKKVSLGIDRWSASVFSITFRPDIDILAVNVKEKCIIGIEVKGYRKKEYLYDYITGIKGEMLDRANVYEAIGEAMMYLKNPYEFRYRSLYIKGSIFDKVYLCYPYGNDFNDFKEVIELTPIGLMSIYEGEMERLKIIRDAKLNPLMNKEAKTYFLEWLYFIKSRCKHYTKD